MSDIIKISAGIVGLESDYNNEITNINNQIPKALRYVGSEMVNELQKQIDSEVYNKYTPKKYVRRKDNPSLGTPLESKKNMRYLVVNDSLDFNYEPTGEYKGFGNWGIANGDELITRIQTTEDLWGSAPPRPFWNYFIDEQETLAVDNFIKGMKPYTVIKDTPEERVNLKEYKLQAGNEQLKFD